MYEYEDTRRVGYTLKDEGTAHFVPVCQKCGRFVKADDTVSVNGLTGELKEESNATCVKCGRVAMQFEGWF